MVGDYLANFDNLPQGTAGRQPKKAVGLIRQLPAEKPDFSWRMRCDVRTGTNMPTNNLVYQGLPSTFLEFGWSNIDKTAENIGGREIDLAASAMSSGDME